MPIEHRNGLPAECYEGVCHRCGYVSVGSEGPKIGRARVTGGERAVLGAGIGSWGMLRRGSRTGWLRKAPE